MEGKIPNVGDYAIIGDCRSAALISRDGSLDWLCWPRFDSDAVFAGILDAAHGGQWSIGVRRVTRQTRRYLPETNVLESRFETADAATVTLTDFMPLADETYARGHLMPDHAVVRLLRCESGRVEADVRFAPRPNFGSGPATITNRGKLGLRVQSSHGMLALHAPVEFEIDGDGARAVVRLNAGEALPLVLTYAESSPEVLPDLSDAAASLERTIAWWHRWGRKTVYAGPHRDAVVRSALTIKLLTYPVSGAIVAAPTTSLPERIGGNLNWDYRYCWLRDAAFAMEALCGTGHHAETEAFAEWMLHATRLTQPRLMVMYDVYGNLAPRERPLKHLAGHRGSSPVNVGNGARDQSQLDTYGEVISGIAVCLKALRHQADREGHRVLLGFGMYVCDHWREPDAGIWEDRGEPVVHTHSRLLCWVALEALLDLHGQGLIREIPAERFRATRDEIRRSIETECWREADGTYTSEPGKLKLDASLLLMALLGFHKASSERMCKTHEQIRRALSAGGPLLYRNLPADGTPIEGAFGVCGFWQVQFIAEGGGTLAEAEQAFNQLLETANDVGLFAEETDPTDGSAVGNFPQAFTHLGLINAAMAIERRRQDDKEPRS